MRFASILFCRGASAPELVLAKDGRDHPEPYNEPDHYRL